MSFKLMRRLQVYRYLQPSDETPYSIHVIRASLFQVQLGINSPDNVIEAQFILDLT